MGLALAIIGTICIVLTYTYLFVGLRSMRQGRSPATIALMVIPLYGTMMFAMTAVEMLWARA